MTLPVPAPFLIYLFTYIIKQTSTAGLKLSAVIGGITCLSNKENR